MMEANEEPQYLLAWAIAMVSFLRPREIGLVLRGYNRIADDPEVTEYDRQVAKWRYAALLKASIVGERMNVVGIAQSFGVQIDDVLGWIESGEIECEIDTLDPLSTVVLEDSIRRFLWSRAVVRIGANTRKVGVKRCVVCGRRFMASCANSKTCPAPPWAEDQQSSCWKIRYREENRIQAERQKSKVERNRFLFLVHRDIGNFNERVN